MVKRFNGWLHWECKVCGAMPDADGVVEHGKGCYTQSEEGGGAEYLEVTESDESQG